MSITPAGLTPITLTHSLDWVVECPPFRRARAAGRPSADLRPGRRGESAIYLTSSHLPSLYYYIPTYLTPSNQSSALGPSSIHPGRTHCRPLASARPVMAGMAAASCRGCATATTAVPAKAAVAFALLAAAAVCVSGQTTPLSQCSAKPKDATWTCGAGGIGQTFNKLTAGCVDPPSSACDAAAYFCKPRRDECETERDDGGSEQGPSFFSGSWYQIVRVNERCTTT